MVNIPKEIMDVLAAPDSAKMIATTNAEGLPNVVPVWSITAVDAETIAFAELFIKHTKENLESNKKVAIAVFKSPMSGYQLKGTFAGFQTSGTLFDNFSENVKKAMNMQIKSVGLIKVDAVYSASPGQDSKKLA
ncbi:MAG: pyridoxamine 5'-phosphate oxidase family protein [Candidatus Bathyarchaeia archaeon]|jgi:predicted pyridoxine 5'-phosphate oxidase superfamily flavin-nucleotide-binding protein